MTAIEDLIKRVEALEKEATEFRKENPRKPLCVKCWNRPSDYGPGSICFECYANRHYREGK